MRQVDSYNFGGATFRLPSKAIVSKARYSYNVFHLIRNLILIEFQVSSLLLKLHNFLYHTSADVDNMKKIEFFEMDFLTIILDGEYE